MQLMLLMLSRATGVLTPLNSLLVPHHPEA